MKPLIIKLQKRDNDVFQANNFKSQLKDNRGDIKKYCTAWYSMGSTAARKADIKPSMQRVVGRQQHESKAETKSTERLVQKSAHNSSNGQSYF